MTLHLVSGADLADIGDTWRGYFVVSDADGIAASADEVTLDVTLPDSTTDSGTVIEREPTGLYEVTYPIVQTGRHELLITATSASFGNDVVALVLAVRATTGALPTLSVVAAYLGETSATMDEIADALEAETRAQARHCFVPVDYPSDLAQALKRRVARNLAARAVPIATFTSFEGGATSSRVPRLDAEIERFEAPYRRWVVA
jgi:hypothetical protein